MSGYRELLEKEIIEAWRTYRIAAVVVMFAVLGIAAPVLTRYLPDLALLLDPTAELGVGETGTPDVVDALVRTLVTFGGLAGILLAMGSVAGERERGTLALVLVRPVGRGAFLLAKLVALGMVLGLGTAVGVLAAWLYTNLLFAPVDPFGWAQLGLAVWLAAMVYAAVTFLGSTLLRSPLGAAAMGLGSLILVTLAASAPAPNPWLPSALVEVARAAALDEFSAELEAGRTIAVSLAIVVGSFVLAWLRFRREDL